MILLTIRVHLALASERATVLPRPGPFCFHGDAICPISDTQAASQISSILDPGVGDPAKGYPV